MTIYSAIIKAEQIPSKEPAPFSKQERRKYIKT
jgi:hypothetical protein